MIDEVRISSIDRGGEVGSGTRFYYYNANNQLTRVKHSGLPDVRYAYDSAGNQTRKWNDEADGDEWEYGFDYRNRLTSFDGPEDENDATYIFYPHHWARHSKTVGEGDDAVVTKFLYDGDNVVAEYDEEAVNKATYVTPFLDQNLAMTIPAGQPDAGTYYYHADGLGSIRNITDATGVVLNTYDYEAFGQAFAPGTSETVPNDYAFTARRLDPESGLQYYRWRQYEAEAGRFTSRDEVESLVVLASGIQTSGGSIESFLDVSLQGTPSVLGQALGDGSGVEIAIDPLGETKRNGDAFAAPCNVTPLRIQRRLGVFDSPVSLRVRARAATKAMLVPHSGRSLYEYAFSAPTAVKDPFGLLDAMSPVATVGAGSIGLKVGSFLTAKTSACWDCSMTSAGKKCNTTWTGPVYQVYCGFWTGWITGNVGCRMITDATRQCVLHASWPCTGDWHRCE